MTITTPSLLFPAISLLLLAYTNRFVVLANVIRQLSGREGARTQCVIRLQIDSLRSRLQIIRAMQIFGVVAFLFCVLATMALFLDHVLIGRWLFGASLILLSVSLVFSVYEIHISTKAINLEIEQLGNPESAS